MLLIKWIFEFSPDLFHVFPINKVSVEIQHVQVLSSIPAQAEEENYFKT